MPTPNDALSAADGTAGLAKSTDNSSTTLFQSLSAADWESYLAMRVQAANPSKGPEPQQSYIRIEELPGLIDRVFARVDADNDKVLSTQELADAVGDASFTGKDAQALAGLYRAKVNLARLYNDESGDPNSVSATDVEVLKGVMTNVDSDGSTESSRQTAIANLVISEAKMAIERTAESQQPDISRDLYANAVDPLESIRANAIAQGIIGNCYFEATLAALADVDPASIARMITDHGNGLFSVKFPDFDVPVFVMAPTETEMGLFNKGSKNGIWACVMEKAFGEYKYMTGGTRSGAIAESADGGGQPKDVFRLMTGADAREIYSSDVEFVREQLLLAKQNGRAVVATTPRNGVERTIDGFAAHHAYSILDFDPDGPDGGTITIRNPWAGLEGTPAGLTRISVQQFSSQFQKLVVQS